MNSQFYDTSSVKEHDTIDDYVCGCLDKCLRDNFNLSSFLFATTPHLLRLSSIETLQLEDSNNSFFQSVGISSHLGRLGALALQHCRHSRDQFIKELFTDSLHSNHVPKNVLHFHLSSDSRTPVMLEHTKPIAAYHDQTFKQQQFKDNEFKQYSTTEYCRLGHHRHSQTDHVIGLQKKNIITPTILKSFTHSQCHQLASDWFLKLDGTRQTALIGLLTGLGLLTLNPINNVTIPELVAPYQSSTPRSSYYLTPNTSYNQEHPPRLTFKLSSLWNALEESSCYGVESPYVDIGTGLCSPIVYIPYLSAIQLQSIQLHDHPVKQMNGDKHDDNRDKTKLCNEIIRFAYFENKPPHVRRPFTQQIYRLAEGLEIPITSEQRHLLMDTETDKINKEESWMSIYWLPIIQQKEVSTLISPPSFLVYYSFVATDDYIFPVPISSINEISHSCFHHQSSQVPFNDISPVLNSPTDLSRNPSDNTSSSVPLEHNHIGLFPHECISNITTNDMTVTELSDNSSTLKLSGFMSATPQLVRFGVIPHKADLQAWGILGHSSNNKCETPLHTTFQTIKHITIGLKMWMDTKQIKHPDYDFISSRLAF